MRIGIIDVDGHNFPNIPLMKISAWHKAIGDDVEWYYPLTSGHMDKVYMSKVFSFTPDYDGFIDADEIVKGGSGYAIHLIGGGVEKYDKSCDKNLPYEIEHTYPDYSIYGITDTAYGFTSRGCPRGCAFCHVAAKEQRASIKTADIDEFWNGQRKIQICDPNVLACKDKRELFDQYIQSKAEIEINQGLDIRLLNHEDLADINSMKISKGGLHFAWDNADDDLLQKFKEFAEGFRRTSKHGGKGTVYCLTNFGNYTLEEHIDRALMRIYALRDLGYSPFVMVYDREHANKELLRLQRWCNNKATFWTCQKYEEYMG